MRISDITKREFGSSYWIFLPGLIVHIFEPQSLAHAGFVVTLKLECELETFVPCARALSHRSVTVYHHEERCEREDERDATQL